MPYALHTQSSADSFSGDYQDLENLPELGHFIAVDSPEAGDMLVYHDEAWATIPLGEEGQILTIVNGLPTWADVPGTDGGTLTDVDGNVCQTIQIGLPGSICQTILRCFCLNDRGIERTEKRGNAFFEIVFLNRLWCYFCCLLRCITKN